jgi:signal transduction histidine kinase
MAKEWKCGPSPETLDEMELDVLTCQQTIDSLLSFSGQETYQFESVQLNDLILEAYEKCLQGQPTDNRVEVVRGLNPHLPPVLVDSKQMTQALFYLLRNAYRAMSAGGMLRITSRVVAKKVQVIVSDTGSGLSPEELRHIFDPFYRQPTGWIYPLPMPLFNGIWAAWRWKASRARHHFYPATSPG